MKAEYKAECPATLKTSKGYFKQKILLMQFTDSWLMLVVRIYDGI